MSGVVQRLLDKNILNASRKMELALRECFKGPMSRGIPEKIVISPHIEQVKRISYDLTDAYPRKLHPTRLNQGLERRSKMRDDYFIPRHEYPLLRISKLYTDVPDRPHGPSAPGGMDPLVREADVRLFKN